MTDKRYNYKLTLAYDGTHFSGWQVQPNGISIQQKLQEALQIITHDQVHVTGSGRTDAGVHALKQVANFRSDNTLDLRRLQASLNGLLPYDIRILKCEEAPLDFHARYSATSKCYHYNLTLSPVQLPFHRLYSWHIRENLDRELLKRAARLFIGTHDFTSFANEAHAGSAAHDPVRTLTRLDIIEHDEGVRLELEANGFLYKMVRNIVGVLHEVATGKRAVEEIDTILAAKDRRQAGKAAPAQGLFLAYVTYGMDNISSKE